MASDFSSFHFTAKILLTEYWWNHRFNLASEAAANFVAANQIKCEIPFNFISWYLGGFQIRTNWANIAFNKLEKVGGWLNNIKFHSWHDEKDENVWRNLFTLIHLALAHIIVVVNIFLWCFACWISSFRMKARKIQKFQFLLVSFSSSVDHSVNEWTMERKELRHKSMKFSWNWHRPSSKWIAIW